MSACLRFILPTLTTLVVLTWARPVHAQAQGAVESPASGSTVAQSFLLRGYAIDTSGATGTGVDVVHVHMCPATNCTGATSFFLGAATYGIARPDVAAYYGAARFTNSGFQILVTGLPAQTYVIVAWAHSAVWNTWFQLYTELTLLPNLSNPQGALEAPVHAAPVTQPFAFSGWEIDTGTTSGTGVDALLVSHCLYYNCVPTWTWIGAATYGAARSDVASVYGAPFLNAGYSKTVTGLAAGAYAFFSYARSTVNGAWTVRSLLAYVNQASSALTIDRLGLGTGAVTGSGLTCSGGAGTQAVVCGATYAFNTTVTLTAVPDPGAIFGGWTGACTGNGTCQVTLAGAQYVAARFTPTAANPALTFYHTDVVGSVRALTSESGAVLIRHDYGPFGEDAASMTGDPIRFGGKELDPETGLENFEARYYRNIWGRFTAVDPAGGWTSDPQSFNAYAYARNNPLKYVDPTGMTYTVCMPDLYNFGCQSASQIQLDEMCYSISNLNCDSSTIAGNIREGDRKVGWYTETSFRDGDASLGEAMAWGGGATLITDEMIFVDKETFPARKEQADQLAAEQAAAEAAYRANVDRQMEAAGIDHSTLTWTGRGYVGRISDPAALQDALSNNRLQFDGPGWAGLVHKLEIGRDASDIRSKDGIFGEGSLQLNISAKQGVIHADVDRASPYGGITHIVAHTVRDVLPWILWGG